MPVGSSDLDRSVETIPLRLRSVFVPQLVSFDAQPMPVRFGCAFRIERPEASGWYWAGAIDDDCLVTSMHIEQRRDFVLVERYQEPCYAISLLTHEDACHMSELWSRKRRSRKRAGLGPEPWDALFPLLEENVVAFSQQPGCYSFNMAAGEVHGGGNLLMLPSFIERVEAQNGFEGQTGLAGLFSSSIDLNGSQELKRLMRLVNPRRANEPGARLHYRSLVLEALSLLQAFATRSSDAGPEQPSAVEREVISTRVRSMLASSLKDPPPLDEIAARLYLSKTKLCTAFKQQTGKSIGDCLADLRVEKAKDLLVDDNLPIEQIAREVGYRHQSSFTTMFRRRTGTTPQAWRNGASAIE